MRQNETKDDTNSEQERENFSCVRKTGLQSGSLSLPREAIVHPESINDRRLEGMTGKRERPRDPFHLEISSYSFFCVSHSLGLS